MNILLVEGCPTTRNVWLNSLRPVSKNLYTSCKLEEAINFINTKTIDIALVDPDLGNGITDGIEIIRVASKKNIQNIIVVTSNDDNEKLIGKCYEIGANDFLTKKNLNKKISTYVAEFLNLKNQSTFKKYFEKEYICSDKEFIKKIALYSSPLISEPILISGDTGTGKTGTAKIIHKTRSRGGPFININAAESSTEMIESELFGYKKGAFTGAYGDKKGKLELAHNGTLFLDEIGNMPLKVQAKLLKAIEEKVFYPIGSEIPIYSNFHIISATKENIFELVKKRQFREDLYYRLNSLKIDIKPLKERKDDIPQLIKLFFKLCDRKYIIDEQVLKFLYNYSWPGNIRQLKNTISEFSTLKKGLITEADIPLYMIAEMGQNLGHASITDEQFNYAKKKSLSGLIKIIEESAVIYSYKNNGHKLKNVCDDLNICSSAYYRIVKKMAKPSQKHLTQ